MFRAMSTRRATRLSSRQRPRRASPIRCCCRCSRRPTAGARTNTRSTLGARAFPFLIDPTSILPRRIEIADGSYINAGCVVGAAARIGRFAFINRGASLGHHLDLGDYASIGPGVTIAGQVRIGPDAMIGAGAVVLPGISIGRGAIVAAGAIVHRDVPDGATVIGRPAA